MKAEGSRTHPSHHTVVFIIAKCLEVVIFLLAVGAKDINLLCEKFSRHEKSEMVIGRNRSLVRLEISSVRIIIMAISWLSNIKC